MIVLFAILFPTIHSYEHFSEQNFVKEKKEAHDFNKNKFKSDNHKAEKCSICDFKFSTFASTPFTVFEFQESISVIYYNFFYFKTASFYFKGSLFALRAPPVTLK